MESDKAAQLLAEWQKLEAQISRIKQEMARLLVVAQDDNKTLPLAIPSLPDTHGAVAKGTRGRQVLEALHRLGESSRVARIAENIPGKESRTPEKHIKVVRGYIRYLAKQGYLRRVRRGLWTISEKGRTSLRQVQSPASEEHDETNER
jgi:hypothetical protein